MKWGTEPMSDINYYGWECTMLKKRAFTLIELLVVIAVIALLLAIIVPALGLAKQKVKMIMCANNQRNVVYGLTVYATENNSKLPPTSSSHDVPGGHYTRPSFLNSYEPLMGWNMPPLLPFVGKFLSGYVTDVEVFNCTLAPIGANSPWPPDTSPHPAKGTYGEFYLNGGYVPLPCTSMLLWNYQGYNHKESAMVDTSLAHFEGPRELGSSNTLVIQDSFFYLTSLGCWMWPAPSGTWRLSHPFKGSSRPIPQYRMTDPGKNVFPDVWLNAGYLDGHVEKFHSTKTKHVKNRARQAWLTRKYK